MKKIVLSLFFTFISISSFAQDKTIVFDEIWGYLNTKDEAAVKASYPITDIGYFAAEINSFGKLVSVPNRKAIRNFSGRVHLVVAQVSNRALTHFSIDPSLPIRDILIADIAKAVKFYDGLQIDFEHVPPQDRYNFYSFLAELKKAIGDKPLSVAVGARTRYIDDAYEYGEIAKIADRIIIMAYDEHWSGSIPGSVASLAWCKKVAQYASKTIPQEKLVMGIPFYSRAWASFNPAKAYKHSGVKKLVNDKNIGAFEFDEEIPFFKYQETVSVTVYYENAASVMKRAAIYDSMDINKIAFWCLGQEDTQIWNNLKITPIPLKKKIKRYIKKYVPRKRK
ncbi:MAG: glycoside hydrolase [Elusimicrobiota bacterium]|jgi:spore germination protein YaaH|nr:glycoside hydrolase [Elusimicrobiota bacterium]